MSEHAGWASAADRAAVLAAAAGARILWDFDGVIADTETIHMDSFRTVLGNHGYIPGPDFFEPLQGQTEARIWEILAEQGAPVHDVSAMIAERSATYLSAALERAHPSWLVLDLIDEFAAVATKQTVLSNGVRATNVELLRAWDLLRYVDVVDRGAAEKADLVAQIVRSGPTVHFEDNAKYSLVARDNGAFCVGVLHPLSPTRTMPVHVTVSI